jgi:hypothetical protein
MIKIFQALQLWFLRKLAILGPFGAHISLVLQLLQSSLLFLMKCHSDSPAARASNERDLKILKAVQECNEATRNKRGVVLCLPKKLRKVIAKGK